MKKCEKHTKSTKKHQKIRARGYRARTPGVYSLSYVLYDACKKRRSRSLNNTGIVMATFLLDDDNWSAAQAAGRKTDSVQLDINI